VVINEDFRKRYYLIVLSAILGPLTTNSLIPIFFELKVNFGLSSIAQVSMVIFFYILPFAIFQLFTGTFSDVVDKKLIVGVGYIIFITGLILSLISLLLQNFILFLLAFFIQGIGFSFISPTILAIINIITPESKKGIMMGLYNSMAGLGVSIGALFSGFLVNFISPDIWYLIFIINPIVSIIILLTFLYALLQCSALVCRTFKLEGKEDLNRENKFRLLLQATIQQLKEGITKTILLLGIIGLFCFFTVITLTNTLNEQIRISLSDLSNEEIILYVSLILTINGLISVAVSPITGYFLKNINPLLMMAIGFLLMFSIIFMPLTTSVFNFMLISFLIYLGTAFIWPALFKASMDLGVEKSGTNSAIINSIRFIGYAMVGPFYLIFGIPGIYFWVFAFCLISIFILLLLKKIY